MDSDSDKTMRRLLKTEGWLKVCESANEMETHSASSWSNYQMSWHPGFCVLRSDEQSFICYKDEQAANRVGRHLERIRLDGGYRAFYRHWGYIVPHHIQIKSVIDEEFLSEDEETEEIDDTLTESSSVFDSSAYSTLKSEKTDNNSYDLIETTPTIESQSLDRRSLWTNHRRVMPSSASTAFLPDNSLAIVESPSTSHKLANFLSRPFSTNPLKRTKSVSKLNRSKRSAVEPEGASFSTWLGGLNNRNNIRNSRSHESLLSYSTTTHAIDLACNGCTVTPLHSSVLGAQHCFQIKTNTGATKYYACRTATERDRWLESLRSMQLNHDQVRRQENSVQLWIFASKNIPCKRKYFCEVCVDNTLYFRTTSKLKLRDECFWGEQFEINHLPKLDTLCLNLYRESDRKKRKDRNTLVGYVQIPVNVLTVRHPVEKWYAVTGAEKLSTKGETPSIRVKARYQTITILPLRAYDGLLQFAQQNYLKICSAVENLTSVKAKEDIATCLVHILHKRRVAKEFLCDLVMSEVESLDNYHLMFRGNSLATKAMEAYMKLVGDQYLHDTLAEFIQNVLESDEDCEVDPSKLANFNVLAKQQETLTRQVHLAWGKIVNSFYDFPIELKQVFYELRSRLEKCGRSDMADYLISSNIFLRFLCPSILSPSLFNLIQEYPNDKTVRNLTLIAKTIQTLANFTKFGVKEHYMEFMNKFVEGEWEHMRQYLMRISSVPSKDYLNRCMEWEGCVDLGKELSLLHSYLLESWSSIEKNLSPPSLASDLRRILDYLSELVDNPNALIRSNSNTESVNSPTSPISDYENNNADMPSGGSPTSAESSSRKYTRRKTSTNNNSNGVLTNGNGNSMHDLRDANGQHKKAASHLNSNDDYVWYAAIDENLGLRRTGLVVQQNRQRHAVGVPSLNDAYNVSLSPGGLSAASAVIGAETEDLNYVDDANDRDTSHDSDHVTDSRGSLTNGPISSGYQSMNYSTSNSSSPVETNQKTQRRSTSASAAKVQMAKTTALAISNPLYCLQTVPLIQQRASSLSLPDIQQEMINSSMGGRVAAANGRFDGSHEYDALYDERTLKESNMSGTKGHYCSPYKNGTPRIPRPSLEIALKNGPMELGIVPPNKCALPRTNPRYMANTGRSPTLPVNGSAATSNFRPIMRRTATDCEIGVTNIPVVESAEDLELRAKFLSELDVTRRKLDATQAKLHEAEEREKNIRCWTPESKAKWSEQMKPFISRLKVVECELQEELSASLQKQRIIEAQQKRIEILQSANENLMATLQQLKQSSAATSPESMINVVGGDDDEMSSTSSSNSSIRFASNVSTCVPLTVIQHPPGALKQNEQSANNEHKNVSPVTSEISEPSTSISTSSDVYCSSTNLYSSELSSPEQRHCRTCNNDEIVLDFAGLKTTEC